MWLFCVAFLFGVAFGLSIESLVSVSRESVGKQRLPLSLFRQPVLPRPSHSLNVEYMEIDERASQ